MLHPRYSLCAIPFLRPDCFCPVLVGKSGKLSSSRPYATMNKDKEVVLVLPAAAAICLFNVYLRGSHPNCVDFPSPCWNHART